ncbi:Glutamate dehydrogenase/leucine dehydrogenase-like protein [Candidatus Koribacter versatilis Ellin345]|uniref:Glutamate dehydrogenase/leucine dehydrogenase-like protein n=1 Tax=Koribacter versatilis (strain Ellin345) TaxID=204669 RepID=Q1IMF7_KORVE|nr:glutamate dehydrogenase [Candidatus Koribacter versatilis]ABF41943.1 Glutamate dehydrogenase/leucine dehydrogenase-like protein [Candidatus Koribacter versatilis Ellin345]
MSTAETFLMSESASFEESLEWERAAQVLDVSPELLRSLRTPQMELVMRRPMVTSAGTEIVPIYGCSYGPASNSTILSVNLGTAGSQRSADAQARDLQMRAALAGLQESASAIAVRIPPETYSERELWMLARECSSDLGRYFPRARLVAADPPSAAFAAWMVHGELSPDLEFPRVPATEYYVANNNHVALSAVTLCASALNACGKALRGSRVVIVGTQPLSRCVVEAFLQEGAAIVGIADESGGLLLQAKDELGDLWTHIERSGLLAEYPGGEHVAYADVLSTPADLLILASGRTEITEGNAATVRATVLAELVAPGLSSGAVDSLSAHGVTVLPATLLHSPCLLPRLSWSARSASDDCADVQNYLGRLWNELENFSRRFKTPLHRSMVLLALQRLAGWSALARP